MMPAAKMLDPLIGIDLHLIMSVPGAPPVPIPHPSIGILFDPIDLIPKIGANVFINGLPRGLAGSAGLMLPHFPIGGVFVKPPENEQEVFMGSKIVSADDEALSYFGLPVLCCQCIGLPPIPRKKGKKKPKVPVGMVLPTGIVIAIPSGIFVGGPPTISLTALLFRAAQAVGGKLLGKGFRRFRARQRNSSRWRNLSQRAHRRADAMANRLGLGDAARNRAHRAICTVTGHPVDVATGKLFTDFTDLELPGPLPFTFERVWYSTSTYRGPFGHGWHHNYDAALYVTAELILHRTADGRAVPYPPLAEGEEYFNRDERCTLSRDAQGYVLTTSEGLGHRFAARALRRGSAGASSGADTPGSAGGQLARDTDGAPSGEAPREYQLREVVSRVGHRVSLRYDEGGHLRELVDSAGRSLGLHVDAEGRIVGLSAPHPDHPEQRFQVASYAYDELGNLVSSTDALGYVFQYQYDGHLLVRETDRTGLNFYFQWDGRDETARCIRTWGDGGIYDRQISYQPGATSVLDSLGHTTLYEHENGLVTRITDARGAVSVTRYEHGQLVEATDAIGRTTRYAYDERGNPTQVLRPDGVKLEVTFDEHNLPVRATDAIGGVWQWRYDELGQLTERTDPLGATTRLVHRRGLPTEIYDASHQRSVFEYDLHGNLTLLIAADGSHNRFRHNALGWPIEVSDPLGNVQRRTFDLCGRMRRVEEVDGNVRDLTYDGEGHLTQLVDRHAEVHMTYRGMGRLATRTQAGTTVRFEYDTEERLRAVINEHGAVFGFERDPVGDVTVERGFDGVIRTYDIDAVGRIRQIERANGLTTFFEYDAQDRVTRVRHSDGTQAQYQYRADSALTHAENEAARLVLDRDPLGRVLREQQGDYAVQSEYDVLGRRVRLTTSLGLEQHIERSPLGDVLAMRASSNTHTDQPERAGQQNDDFEVRFTRDAQGLEQLRELPGGVQSRWVRDNLGRPLQHEIFTQHHRHRARGYNWDVNGRLLRLIDAVAGPVQFTHDALGQLATAVHADGRAELRLPDAVGNLFRRSDRKDRRYGPAGQLLESVDGQGRITRFSYDSVGQLVEKRLHGGASWRYRWNADGHLTEVIRPDGSSVHFEYDAVGRRISKLYRGQRTRWVWDADVPLHEWVEGELSGPSAQAAPGAFSDDARANRREAELNEHLVRGPPERGSSQQPITWLFEPETFSPLAKLVGARAESIVTDHLGTPFALLSDRGELSWSGELDSWGELNLHSGSRADCPFRWPGQYEDLETGLYYNRFRYYDPEAGQYISQDPIGLAGGMAVYGYVSDPLACLDPFGLTAYGGGGLVTVFRVQLRNSSGIVTGGAFAALRRSGRNLVAANRERLKLLRRTQSSDPNVARNALRQAQGGARSSPYISTTFDGPGAIAHAAQRRANGEDVEVLTITGPRSGGLDFEQRFQELGGRTSRPQDADMQEFGIPDLFIPPRGQSRSGFEIVDRA